MKRKICSVLAAAIAIGTISMLSVSAAGEPPAGSAWVYLKPDQYSQTSKTVNGTDKYIGGTNSANSKHTVVYKAQYCKPGTKSYVDDKIEDLDPGHSILFPNVRTTVRSSGAWRLELRPYGRIFQKCTADGWIYKDM